MYVIKLLLTLPKEKQRTRTIQTNSVHSRAPALNNSVHSRVPALNNSVHSRVPALNNSMYVVPLLRYVCSTIVELCM